MAAVSAFPPVVFPRASSCTRRTFPKYSSTSAGAISQNGQPNHARTCSRCVTSRPTARSHRPAAARAVAGRARRAAVRNALEPEWETRFEPRSYRFRPGRGCHDAIEAIYQVIKGRDPRRQ